MRASATSLPRTLQYVLELCDVASLWHEPIVTLLMFRGDPSFPQENSLNRTWHFFIICGSPWQITVNSAVESQLKESQLCCS